MTTDSPACLGCTHLHRDPAATKNTCAAFPEGIPAAIFFDGKPHTRAYPGDHGIRFTPLVPASALAR